MGSNSSFRGWKAGWCNWLDRTSISQGSLFWQATCILNCPDEANWVLTSSRDLFWSNLEPLTPPLEVCYSPSVMGVFCVFQFQLKCHPPSCQCVEQCQPWVIWCPRQDFSWRPLELQSISQSIFIHSHRNCMYVFKIVFLLSQKHLTK